MSIFDPEGMLDNIKPAQVASLGPVGGLSTSDTNRLNTAYNVDGPQFTTTPASSKIGDGPVFNLNRVAYRQFYKDVMDDNSSYQAAPTLGLTSVEGEPAPGSDGSTIGASGLGPNVNVTGFTQKEQKMVDGKSSRFFFQSSTRSCRRRKHPKGNSTCVFRAS